MENEDIKLFLIGSLNHKARIINAFQHGGLVAQADY